MKIDTDLRMAINAAARAQKEPTHDERHKAEQSAIAALLKKHAAVVKKARQLEAKRNKLNDEARKVGAEITKTLKPLGIEFACRRGTEFELGYNEEAKEAFVKAGGVLPPPSKRKWMADSVIKRLVAADPSERDAILKEYGINWS